MEILQVYQFLTQTACTTILFEIDSLHSYFSNRRGTTRDIVIFFVSKMKSWINVDIIGMVVKSTTVPAHIIFALV